MTGGHEVSLVEIGQHPVSRGEVLLVPDWHLLACHMLKSLGDVQLAKLSWNKIGKGGFQC